MTTDSPTGSETLEERPAWDGTAGTAVAYIRTLEADRARLRAEVARRDVALRQVHDHWTAAEKRQRERAEAAEARASRREEALREILKLDYGFLAAKSIASHALTEGGDIESV